MSEHDPIMEELVRRIALTCTRGQSPHAIPCNGPVSMYKSFGIIQSLCELHADRVGAELVPQVNKAK